MRAYVEPPSVVERHFFLVKTRNDPEFEFSWHHHPRFELTHVRASRGLRFVGDSVAPYGPDDLVLLAPGVPHTWQSRGPAGSLHTSLVVQFETGLFGADVLRRLPGTAVGRMLVRARQGLAFRSSTVAAVRAHLDRLMSLSPLAQLGDLCHVLDRLAVAEDVEALSSRRFVADFDQVSADPLDRVCRLVERRIGGRLTLEEVAAEAAMSVSTFTRAFKRATGRSFVRYLNQVRISLASQLLIETDRKISDVAAEVGCPNLSHFNALFLREKGRTPRAYRRLYRTP
jgi:AraC-like DNA-binding protein